MFFNRKWTNRLKTRILVEFISNWNDYSISIAVVVVFFHLLLLFIHIHSSVTRVDVCVFLFYQVSLIKHAQVHSVSHTVLCHGCVYYITAVKVFYAPAFEADYIFLSGFSATRVSFPLLVCVCVVMRITQFCMLLRAEKWSHRGEEEKYEQSKTLKYIENNALPRVGALQCCDREREEKSEWKRRAMINSEREQVKRKV